MSFWAELEQTAQALVAPGKGILASDESTGSMNKHLEKIGVDQTPERRREFREIVYSADGLGSYISGAIMFDEVIRAKTTTGTLFTEVLRSHGVIPGIKTDKGAKPLPFHGEETVTEGLDGLRERNKEYYEMGARFAKWRAVIRIGDRMPSRACLSTNAHALARYAALSQEQGLCPIVEPEVLMDGAHDAQRCYEVTEAILKETYAELYTQGVRLEGTLLKPNMVNAGKDNPTPLPTEQVAEQTLKVLYNCVPSAVPGIVFLSGGMTDAVSTANLDAMNRRGPHPWALTFSYGRALQQSALKAWGGKTENYAAAQRAFLKRARLNGAAASGTYSADMEQAA